MLDGGSSTDPAGMGSDRKRGSSSVTCNPTGRPFNRTCMAVTCSAVSVYRAVGIGRVIVVGVLPLLIANNATPPGWLRRQWA